MNIFQIHPLLIPILISLLAIWAIVKLFSKPAGNKNLPPSPPKLPIIGNLHQLGSLPHQDLHILAKKHGPFMLLHFAKKPVLIVSSADAAREVMRTHDLIFADRPQFGLIMKLLYDGKDMTFSPYGEYWRKLKTILVHQVFTNSRVQSFCANRESETALFVKKIRESSGLVNLSKMFFEFSNNGICLSAFGRKFDKLVNEKKFLVLAEMLSDVAGVYTIGDLIPWLRWINHVNGFGKKVDQLFRGFDDFIESVVEERLNTQKQESFEHTNPDNFLDIMLDIYNGKNIGLSIDRESIKALLLDVIVAGTDTTGIALEWNMAELLRNAKVMEKLQKEVRGTVKDREDITDDDLSKMHYLKAVIKESLRLHPPLPLLVPRQARRDVKVKGYDISAGTMVLTNAWAIGRDEASWDEPQKFKPERFLNSSKDFKGLDFELIPFGAGKRSCPGITYAVATMEFLLANLMHKFDWKLPDGAEDLDMREYHAFTVHKRIPLLAVATERN